MADFTMDRFSLKGKTALVTGAERGIGLEIAKGLAAAGADIIIAGLMKEEFPKAEAAVRAKGVSCTVLKADISKEEDVLRRLGYIDRSGTDGVILLIYAP